MPLGGQCRPGPRVITPIPINYVECGSCVELLSSAASKRSSYVDRAGALHTSMYLGSPTICRHAVRHTVSGVRLGQGLAQQCVGHGFVIAAEICTCPARVWHVGAHSCRCRNLRAAIASSVSMPFLPLRSGFLSMPRTPCSGSEGEARLQAQVHAHGAVYTALCSVLSGHAHSSAVPSGWACLQLLPPAAAPCSG